MKNGIFTLQFVNLVFETQLTLQIKRFTLLFFLCYQMQFLLLLRKHFFIALSSFGELLTMSFVHIFQYFLKLLYFQVSFISLKQYNIQLFLILIYESANALFFASKRSYFGLISFAHLKSLFEISLDLLILSLQSS